MPAPVGAAACCWILWISRCRALNSLLPWPVLGFERRLSLLNLLRVGYGFSALMMATLAGGACRTQDDHHNK